MNVSCMTNVLKKLAFPLVAGGMLMAVSTATAQDYGDIERIYKFPEGASKYLAPITTPGETVAFRIRLFNAAGNFSKVYVGAGSAALDDLINPFMMQIETGQGLTYAKLTGMTAVSDDQTDLEFTYTVRAGDMALPMLLYGNAGSSSVGTPYEFLNGNIWKIRNLGNSSNAVWRFVAMAVNPDPTFAKANVRLQTVDFESEEWEVQKTTTLLNCLVRTTTGQAVSNNVPLYVWSGDTNIAQIVEQQAGQHSAAVTLLPGESQRAFRIYGKNEGQALIYLSPSPSMTAGVTNYITKTVTVTAPPPPTVSVSLEPLVTELDGFVHLSESDVKENPLHVMFSQAYVSGPVTIRLDVSPAGAVTLETNRVTLAAGVTESALVRFAPADGISEVTITPVIETAGAIPYFVGAPVPAKIKIANVVPSVVLSNPTPNPPVSTQTTEFPWALTDVTADVSAGVVFKWSFGDGSTLVETNYTTSGSVAHIYNNSAAANRTLRLEIKDKDMAVFYQVAEMSFTVDLPVATPKLELVTQPSASETSGLMRVQFALSQSYAQEVTVQLTVEPPEWTNNIVFQDLLPGQTLPSPVTIPATKLVNEVDFDIWYKVIDGNTNTASLVFRPAVVSTPGDPAYYTPVPRSIFIRNTPPQITAVNGQSVNAISNVTVAATMSKTYTVDVKDVAADLGSIRTYWVFSDEPTNVYVAAGSAMPLLGAAKASIDHTFSTPGIYTVRVWAEDKDQAPGASADAYREFYVVVGAPPTVRVRPPSGSISEAALVTDNDYIVVELNVAPPIGAVYVNLSVSPTNNSGNGSLVFDTNSVIFTREELNLGVLEKRVSINSLLKDGTRISNSTGFTVTPTVTGSVGIPEFYGANLVAGVVRVHNENPKIINPKNMDTAGTEVAFSVGQGTAHLFDWDIEDADEDWNFEPGSTITWHFNDGTPPYTSSLKAGSYSKTYNTLGVKTVRFVARDKDGGSHEVSFNIRVDPAKRLDVTPVGHISGSASGEYAGAAGLGRGIVVSSNAVPVTGLFVGDKYQFSYDPAEAAAELLAIPMMVDSTFDSFMYRWMGEGFPVLDLVTVSPRGTRVALEQSVAGADGQTQAQTPPTVNAVFSRELFQADNCGDINGDGIPDRIASSTIWLSGQTLNAILGSDLVPAGRYNGDNDFLPDRDNNADWIIAGLGTYAPVGHTFDAYREIRGYHSGLNRLDFGSDEDFGPGEEQIHMDFGPNQNPYTRAAERPTDPTVDDTDGDGFPDGWEYYFWYNTLVRHITGSRYNPADVATGITIPWEDLYLAFDPLTPDSRTNRDIDNDGLTDREELVIGTNPIHWDSDGDGMCDGWEVLRGLDPLNLNDRDDARDARYNNPDGDYMAIAVVKRDLVTGVDGKTYLQNAKDGSMTAWYRYGTTNATTPIAVGTNVTGIAIDTSIQAVTNQNVLILHFQVYHEFGFDPRTAWCGAVGRMPDYAQNYPVPDGWFALDGAFRSRFSINPWEESDAANTRPFTAYDEYLLMKFMAANGLAPAAAAPSAAGWSRSTHPKTPDSDATDVLVDGVPDGWELYVMCEPGSRTIGISPWSAGDGVADVENPADPNRGDGLTVRREFSGTDSAAAYASPALYTATTVTVDYNDTGISYQTVDLPKNTITLTDPGWVNKFWPTDPWSKDTDGDGVRDGAELAFNYGGTDNGSTCIVGGGLNPCSVDTDLDALPDGFELQFTHSSPGAADGMDGTVKDADGDATDWDKDGLENYQEYWVQAVRGFRYDITTNDLTAAESITQAAVTGLPMDQNYDPSDLFTQVTNTWDVARYAFGDTEPPLWVMLPVGARRLYVSTDPRDADTDNDSLDDFYEMFHGLNPILGVLYAGDVDERLTDRVARAHRLRNGGVTITAFANDWAPAPLEMDFVSYPWLTGLQTADPDADGLLTFEEMLQPNQPTPSYHNTDPTPLWLTDSASWESVTARFYNPRLNMVEDPAAGRWKGMFFWPLSADRPSYVFSFEENEGYDTDNDGLSDKDELTQGMGGYGDPQDHDDPIRRQALWFDGTRSAAYTPSSFNYGAYAFRSFTVELWVRPETVTNDVGQVLIERPVVYTGQSDLSDPGTLMRRTFQLGIAADGRAYAMFENAGFHEEHTGTAEVFGPVLRTNEWVHLAARMDGQTLTIFVNGQTANSQPTPLIPATGVLNVSTDPASDVGYIFTAAPLVLGSANDSLSVPVWGDFSRFFHGYIDEVRVWDGARASQDIAADFRTRYTKSQEAANQASATGNRLIYHYTFDNLFGAETASDVLQVPRGFEALAVTTNRPSGYQVGWWSALPVASLVYTNYAYVPWIENGVDHLPLGGGRVQNSVYWAEGSVGGVSANNVFPNSNNPYGWGYGFVGAADLVPLGFAFARTLPDLWDGQGQSSFWSDTNDDSDWDGLADWWESSLATNYFDAAVGWYDVSANGMTAGERYLRDLAAGYRPGDTLGAPTGLPQVADSDHDGMPDWWEQMFGLNLENATGGNGSQDDPDEDGLTNLYEYLAGTNPFLADTDNNGIWDAHEDSDGDGVINMEEMRQDADPGSRDTDDDGMEDGVEADAGTHLVFSDSPKKSLSLALTAAEEIGIPQPFQDRERFINKAWTLEMWVNPSVAGQTASLIRYEASAGTAIAPIVCYQLGLTAGVPYVRMAVTADSGAWIDVQGGELPVNEWTHVCGVFDPEADALTLYINGYALAAKYVMGEALIGSTRFSNNQGVAKIGGGFDGHLDDVRVWKQALSQDQVVDGIEHLVTAGDTRLVCYFRFDDGGLTAEDSAHPIRPTSTVSSPSVQWPTSLQEAREYCLEGVTFDAAVAYEGLRLEFDDFDGDGLPDWWESFRGNIQTAYPVTRVATVTEISGDNTVWVDKYLTFDHEETESISPPMEPSSSLLDLGWGVQYGPVTSVPRYTRPDGTTGGYLDDLADASWLLKDVYISAEELDTVEVRFTSHSIAAEDILCINGKMLPLNTLQISSVMVDASATTPNYRLELWENRYNFQLQPEFLRKGGYFKVGWNRIAVKLLNQDGEVGSRRYEYFDLTLMALGEKTIIDYGERWYRFGFTGSLVEPPKDGQGRIWSDPDYGKDAGADLDGDGLPNVFEAMVGTNPNAMDTDGDGVLDSHEDYDGDGLQNLLEFSKGTDPRLPDTDDDGRLDSADGYVGLSQSWATNSLQPFIERHLHVSGDGFVQAPLVSRWSSDEGSFTLRLSVRPASLPAGTPAVLAAREVSAGVFNYAILLRTDGKVQVSVTTDTGSAAPQQLDVVSAAAIPVGQWSSIDMVADLGMQRLLLLVNGQNSGSAFGNMSGLPAASGKGLARAYFGSGLNGDLDNIAFYREALSEYQLKRIREEGVLNVATPSLYGCYLFDDGTSATGVSGMGSWRTGQVQDFACIFWSEDAQNAAGFTLQDWSRGWFNAGTLYGAQTAVIDTYPANPSTDNDDDGLPDTWEMTYGFDAYDSTGENGALADPDGDGLSNYAEYLASAVYGFHAVNPRLFSTTQSVSDYFLRTGSLYLGEMFTDHDFMEDAWEDGFAPDKVSAAIYDAHLDNDEDGWSNWAEARFSAAKNDVRPDQVMSVTSAGQSRHELPIPVVEALVRYNGIRSEAAVVVQAYKDDAMDGQPDATFRMATGTGSAGSMPLGDWRPRTVSGTLTPGNVQRGSVSLEFTDSWTGGSMATGFDQDGLLYRGDPIGEYEVIGTIDYASGAYVLDLTAFAGQTLDLVQATVGQTLARDQYIDCEQSSVVMNYSYRLVENWPKRLFLGRATTGYLREGLNTFFAFLDSNNDGVWNVGEPCGMPHPAATAIGWDHNEIVIELTDYVQGYLRMAIPSGVRSEDVFKGTASDDTGPDGQGGMEQRVRIVRTGVDGQKRHTRVVLDKVVRSPRSWLNESDLWAQGDLALDWGLVFVDTALDRTRLSYEVFLGETTTFTNGAVAFFTNTFDMVRAKAVNVAPINGAYVCAARPTFKWRLPTGTETKYPAFAFEMRLGSPQGTVMYESGAMPVPARNANGEFVWEAPIYANTRLPNGQVFQSNKVYAWRVIAMNAKFSDTDSNWSDWKYFRLDVNAPMQSSGYGSAEARVKYYGPAAAMLTGRVKVQAYRTASFTGMPEAEYTLAGTDLAALTSLAAPVVNARLYGLQESGVAGPYYLCAYIDHNGNDVRDPWESWGYANHYGVDTVLPYMARAVEVLYSAAAPRLDIVIEDADTDQDWVPDAWEYEQNPAGDFLDLVGPATGAAGDTEINPYLGGLLSQTPAFFTMLALGTTDLDGDGLGDLNELLLGSDARSASTAGDGFTDGDKTALGLNPADSLRLDVTGITLANGQPEVQWSVEVEKSATASLSLAPEVTYELLYTPSLGNPQWQVVRSGKVALDGVQTLTSQIESAVSVDPAQGFFRVRLQK